MSNSLGRWEKLRHREYNDESSIVLRLCIILLGSFYAIHAVPDAVKNQSGFWGLWIVMMLLNLIQQKPLRSPLTDAVFAILDMGIIIYFEITARAQHVLLGWLYINLPLRIFIYKNRENVLAAAIGYFYIFSVSTASMGGLDAAGANQYTMSSTLYAICVLMAWIFAAEIIYKRICCKTWDEVHHLLVARERVRLCSVARAKVIESHFCPVTLREMLNDNPATCRSGHDDDNDNNNDNDDDDGEEDEEDKVITNLFLSPHTAKDDAGLSLKAISSLGGLTKRSCALIAVRARNFDQGDSGGTNMYQEHDACALYDVVSDIAARNNVMHVRQFGSTWIGCLGFFSSSSSDPASFSSVGGAGGGKEEESAHVAFADEDERHRVLLCERATDFGAEVCTVAQGLSRRVCVAVDANVICGGFVGARVDVFGPEVRWVIRMAQEAPTERHNAMLVSSEVRKRLANSLQTYIPKICVSALSSNLGTFYQPEEAYSIPPLETTSVTPEEQEGYSKLFAEARQRVGDSKHVDYVAILRDVERSHRISTANSRAKGFVGGLLPFGVRLGELINGWSESVAFNEQLTALSNNEEDHLGDGTIFADIDDATYEVMHAQMKATVVDWVFSSCFKNNWLMFFALVKLHDDLSSWNTPWSSHLNQLLKQPLLEEVASPVIAVWTAMLDMVMCLGQDLYYSIIACGAEDDEEAYNNMAAKYKSWQRKDKPAAQRYKPKKKPSSSHASASSYVVPADPNPEEGTDILDSSVQAPLRVHFLKQPQTQTYTHTHIHSEDNERKSSSDVSNSDKEQQQTAEKPASSSKSSSDVTKATARSRRGGPSSSVSWGQFRETALVVSNQPVLSIFFYTLVFFFSIIVLVNSPKNVLNLEFPLFKGEDWQMTTILLGLFISRSIFDASNFFAEQVIAIPLTIIAYLKFPSLEVCASGLYTSPFGDDGGASVISVVITAVCLVEYRRSFKLTAAYVGLIIFIMDVRDRQLTVQCQKIFDQPYHYTFRTRKSALMLLVCGSFLIWTLEYATYLLFNLRHKIVPLVIRRLNAKIANARKTFALVEPQGAALGNANLLKPTSYSRCAVISVTTKAATTLPSILSAEEFESFYKQVSELIDRAVRECELVKAIEFGGTTVIFTARDFDRSYFFHSMSHAQRASAFLSNLHNRLDFLAASLGFSIELEIGMDLGGATIGLLGGHRHCFNVAGNAQDLSYLMSSSSSATSGIPRSMVSNSFFNRTATASMNNNIGNGILGDTFKNFMIRSFTFLYRGEKILLHSLTRNVDGMSLEDFELLSMLGKGGYGSVHLVREIKTAHRYAIKVIPQRSHCSIANMAREEFLVLQQVQHINVITFKFCLMANSRLYFIMDFVESGNLKQVVENHRPPLEHLAFWFKELVSALEYIHSIGIIHRDVKPANCLVGADGHLRLSDFGLSRITRSSSSNSSSSGGGGRAVASSPGETLSPGTVKMLQKFMPLKAKTDEDYTESPYEILVVPLPLRSLPESEVQDEVEATRKSLQEMLFNVSPAGLHASLSSSSNGAAAIRLTADVVFVELVVGSSQESMEVNRDTLLLSLLDKLTEMSKVGSPYKDIPIMVLSPNHSFFSRSEQTEWQNQFPAIKNFLVKPIQLSDRASIRYEGTLARKLELRPVLEKDEEAEDSESTFGPSGTNSALTSSIDNAASQNRAAEFDEDLDGQELAEEEVKDATKSNRLLRMSRHKAGTPQFMAPEIIERGEYSTAVDWWATGVTFFNCAVGQHLFRGRDHASLYAQICSGEINLGPLRPVSETLQNLVSRLVERDVSKRLGGGRVIRTHRFFVAMDEQRRTVRGGPPFRPPSMPVQYLAEKNLLLFYGARGLARASGTPRRPLFSTSAGSLGVLKRAKKIARQRMRREFSRFASISELRERWLRGLGTGEAQLPLTSSDHDHS